MKQILLTAALAALTVLTALNPAGASSGKIVFASDRTGTNNIYIMNPDGSSQAQLTNTAGTAFEFPTVSPDGSKIVCQTGQPALSDVLMNFDGTGQFVVTNTDTPYYPNFVPGTNLISFSASSPQDYNIYTINQNGTNKTQIIQNTYGSYWGRWNPAGTKVCFLTFLTAIPNADLFVANADGSGQTQITTTHADRDASWSPDGTKLVFQSTRDGGGSQIYVMNADGSNPTRLTDNTANDSNPCFSPDGTEIAFASDRAGTNQIYTMNVDGTNQTRITSDAGNDTSPFWSVTVASNPPSASISDVSTTAPKSGMANAVFTVTLSAPSSSSLSVSYRTADGTAVAGKDYTAESGTLVFAARTTSATVTVPILADAVYAATKSFSVSIAPVGSYTAKQVGTGTILNANPEPSLTLGSVSQDEGASGTAPFNFPVTLSGASSVATIVNYATANGTALAGSDYVATSGTLTIPAGATTGTIAVPVYGSTILENTKTFTVTLSAPVNATLATSVATGTILNTNTTPALSAGNASANEGGPEVFTLTLGHVAAKAITAAYATADGTALAGTNYFSTSGSVTIPPGQLTATVTVSTIATSTINLAKTFTLNITAAPGAVITGAQGTGTIVNTVLPYIYLDNVSLLSGNSGSRDMYFSLCLSDPAPFPVSVHFASSSGSAIAGTDYTAVAGNYTFSPGVTSVALPVQIFGSNTYGPNKTFTITLSTPVQGNILTPTVEGIIIPSASLPGIGIDNVAVVQPASGTTTAPFKVTLTNPSTAQVTVNYATSAGTAVAGTDFTSATGVVTFPPGATSEPVNVTVLGHANPKSNATFNVYLMRSSGALIDTGTGTGTITKAAPAPG